MKLLTFRQGGFERLGWLQDEDQSVLAFSMDDVNAPHTMLDAIKRGPYALQQLRSSQEQLEKFRLEELELLSPIGNPGAIFCASGSHTSTCGDQTSECTAHQAISMRLARNLVAPHDALIVPTAAVSLGLQGGLAAIIGKRGRYIEAHHAREHIFAYCMYAEGIVTGPQGQATPCTLGDNFEASASYGPFVVTADEIGDPYLQNLSVEVDGSSVVNASVSSTTSRIDALIEHISSTMELHPGDIIFAGSSTGAQTEHEQGIAVKDGEVISVSISGLGTLVNPIKAENTERNPVACSC